jgi:hypothetical protein
MAKRLVGKMSSVKLGRVSTTALAQVGERFQDSEGNTYMYVGASGVAVGAPVKVAGSPLSLAKCVTGTDHDILGVATQAFPSTGFTFGLIGLQGIHPTRVPSGVGAGSLRMGGNGTTATAANDSVHVRVGKALVAAQNDGSAVNVLWL